LNAEVHKFDHRKTVKSSCAGFPLITYHWGVREQTVWRGVRITMRSNGVT